MNVSIFMRIGGIYRIDHHLRLLSGGAVVEIDQRLAVHLAREDREITAKIFDIEHHAPPTNSALTTLKKADSPINIAKKPKMTTPAALNELSNPCARPTNTTRITKP